MVTRARRTSEVELTNTFKWTVFPLTSVALNQSESLRGTMILTTKHYSEAVVNLISTLSRSKFKSYLHNLNGLSLEFITTLND